MSIIKISGKPIEKLIEVVSNAIGTLYKPSAIKNEANSEAYRIKIIERAKAEALADSKNIEIENYLQIEQRLLFKETKKQLNIDKVVSIAEEHILLEESVSEESVNTDWTTRFFNIVEDVSDEEMQKLWGRILAGEIKSPNSFSLRTLEILKNISKDEAEIFTRIAPAIIKSSKCFIYNTDDGVFLNDKFDIKYNDLLKLSDAGLISHADSISYVLKPKSGQKTFGFFLKNGERGIYVETLQEGVIFQFDVIPLTKAGEELTDLIVTIPNDAYLNKICFELWNTSTNIKYGDITNNSSNKPELTNIKEYKR